MENVPDKTPEKIPWFSTKGQILQLLVQVVALCLAAYLAFPGMATNNLLSVGAILFYLLVIGVLVSVWVLISSVKRASSRELKTTSEVSNRERGHWVSPLLYGLSSALGLYVLFVFVGIPGQSQYLRSSLPVVNPSEVQQTMIPAPTVSSSISDTPAMPTPQSLEFTYAQQTELHREFLSVPRPCIFRIASSSENAALRQNLMDLISRARVVSVEGWGSRESGVLPACETRDEEMDRNPDLYPDQVQSIRPEIITVNTAEEDSLVAGFVASRLKTFAGLRTTTGHTLPPKSPEHLIYIQIGTGRIRD